MKSYNIYISIVFLAFITLIACEDEFQQPFNQVIPSDQSNLIGLWEGNSIRKDFAKNVQDEFGNNVVDDKNRTLWQDTTVFISREDGYSEFLYFESTNGIDAFRFSRADSLDSAGVVVPQLIPNMPFMQGQWAVIRTIDPEKDKMDVTSITFYDPAVTHNPLGSMVWTIKSQDQNELVVEYSFGSPSYDTLFVKTFRRR